MQTDDIAAWLTQIWDAEADEPAPHHLGCIYVADGDRGGLLPCDCGYPAQMLARIAADRAILELHMGPHDCTVIRTGTYPDDWPEYIPWGKAGTEWRHPSNEYFEDEACPTVRLKAAQYADRPGYNEQWRP